jgi:transcriptional regulator GlxA family with amidase domain
MGVVSMAQRVLPAVRAVTIAAAAGPVALAGGLTVMAEFGFANAPDCDVVVVCGGPGWTQQVTDAGMLGFLQQLHSSRIASVCTGAMILSAAGMLDGLLATTRRRAVGEESAAPLDRIASFGHGVQPRASLVVDAGVVTGGGVSLAIDTMLYLLGRLYGAEARDTVAEVIEYDRAWAANRAALGIAVVAPT